MTTSADLARFNAEIDTFNKNWPEEFVRFVRQVAIELFRRIVLKTPVDTGRARGNWQLTLGAPSGAVLEVQDESGGGTIGRAVATLGGLRPFVDVWISNNVPYIEVLENGGFRPANPGPTRDPRRRGEILVRGGFSVQAPHGMVAVSVREVETIFP